jgi:beta-glucosidase
MKLACLAVVSISAFTALSGVAQAQVKCSPFTAAPLTPPAPRTEDWAIPIVEQVNAAVKTQPYRALFLGDSLVQRWDLDLWDAKPVWDTNLAPRGVLSAGVAGDRTDQLLWRLDHGTLAGPPPQVVIVLIGTDDLPAGRTPELTAQGVRAVLIRLRQKLPNTRVLLLGLLPRGATKDDPMREAVGAVNQMIQSCADGKTIVYADIGGVLLDSNGVLSTKLSPDLLHFTGAGYKLLAAKLDPLIDQLENAR